MNNNNNNNNNSNNNDNGSFLNRRRGRGEEEEADSQPRQVQVTNVRRGSEEFRGENAGNDEEIQDNFTERSLYFEVPPEEDSVWLSQQESANLHREINNLRSQVQRLRDWVLRRNAHIRVDGFLAQSARQRQISRRQLAGAVLRHLTRTAEEEEEEGEIEPELRLDPDLSDPDLRQDPDLDGAH